MTVQILSSGLYEWQCGDCRQGYMHDSAEIVVRGIWLTVQFLPVNSLGEYSIYQIMLHFEQGFFTFLIGQLAREAITLIVIVSTKPRRALRTVPTVPNKFYSFLFLKSGTSFQTIICLFFEINLNSNLNVKKLSKLFICQRLLWAWCR